MDKTLIENWNARVKEEDTVWHIGDFCFKNTISMAHRGEGNIHPASYYESKLNGKIIFIKGSHDKNNSCKTCLLNATIELGGYRMGLVHDPKHVKPNFDFNLVGHVHNLWKCHRIHVNFKAVDMINVGVDMWNFRPITIEEITAEYMRWKKTLELSITKKNKLPVKTGEVIDI